MSTLRTRITASLQAFKSKVVGSSYPGVAPSPLIAATAPSADPVAVDWPYGTATGQASKAWSVEVSLNASQSVTYNLLALTDEFGDAVAFSKVKAFAMHTVSGTGRSQLNAGLFNPINAGDPGYDIGSSFLMIRPAGISVSVDDLNNTMTITASGGNVVVRVQIVGD